MIKVIEIDGVKYVKSMNLCYAMKDRIDFALSKKLLSFNKDYQDYFFSEEAMRKYVNFFMWLAGAHNKLILIGGMQENVVKKTRNSIEDIFDGM